jgi:ribose transport system permease protein
MAGTMVVDVQEGWAAARLRRIIATPHELHAFSIRVCTVLLILLAILFVPHFAGYANAQAIMYSLATVGIGAAGMALVTLSGNLFMLSMGATSALSTVLFASSIELGLFPALLLVLCAGTIIGLMQGLLIGAAETNPIITTIAASSIISGVGVLWTGGITVVGAGGAHWLGFGHVLGVVPNQILVTLIFAAVAGFIVQRTRLGREIRLIGMQRDVARVAGLRLIRATLFCYGFAGAAAALAGGLIASASTQGNLSYGIDLDFNAIAAVLVGGVSIRGGRGRIADAVMGATFLCVVGNVLLVSGVSYDYQLVVKGAVVLASVIAGALLGQLAPRLQRRVGVET